MKLICFDAVTMHSIGEETEFKSCMKELMKDLKMRTQDSVFLPMIDDTNPYRCIIKNEYSFLAHIKECLIIIEYNSYEFIECNRFSVLISTNHDEDISYPNKQFEILRNIIAQFFSSIDEDVKLVWVQDDDSRELSSELYSVFYKVENSIRSFINTVLVNEYGPCWWEKQVTTMDGENQCIIPSGIVRKQKKYNENYDKIVTDSFESADTFLLSLDVRDLRKIMYGMSVSEENNPFKITNELFLKYTRVSFIEIFDDYCDNRNHIAHNKLVDRKMYDLILENAEQLDYYLGSVSSSYYQRNVSVEHDAENKRVYKNEQEEINEIREDIISEYNLVVFSDKELVFFFYEILNRIYSCLQERIGELYIIRCIDEEEEFDCDEEINKQWLRVCRDGKDDIYIGYEFKPIGLDAGLSELRVYSFDSDTQEPLDQIGNTLTHRNADVSLRAEFVTPEKMVDESEILDMVECIVEYICSGE